MIARVGRYSCNFLRAARFVETFGQVGIRRYWSEENGTILGCTEKDHHPGDRLVILAHNLCLELVIWADIARAQSVNPNPA